MKNLIFGANLVVGVILLNILISYQNPLWMIPIIFIASVINFAAAAQSLSSIIKEN